jgi:hypothetical protein
MIHQQRATFLKSMQELLNQTESNYRAYLNSGKIFLYARILRETNANLRTCIAANLPLLPEEHRGYALRLIYHLDVWTALWEEAFEQAKPEPNSVFSFENSVNFPQEAVAHLVNFAKKNE